MGIFFKRQSTDEKGFDSPPVQDAAAPGYAIEEGIVDEAQDDLHHMMAIAGAIGTGLIIGTGTALKFGPGSLLIGYVLMGFVVYVVMVALGEMGAWLPHKKSFSGYATRFVDPAMGFATGWNYFFKYVIVLPNNLTATGIILQYWLPNINVSVWIVVFGVVIIVLNLIHVSFFGEAEFWMSLCKALVILTLILLCFIISLGGGPNHVRSGFSYWRDPGAFGQYFVTLNGETHTIEGATGRFVGVWACIVQATFAYLGTELVGVAFGETPNPRKNVPRAVNQTLLRIVFFYVAGVLVLGMAVPYNSPELLQATKQRTSGLASPFTVAAKRSGIDKLGDAVNGMLLIFTLSAANSDIYLASRSVWALAKDGQAPSIMKRTNKRGVPIPAVILSSVFIVLGFMNATKSAATVFGYFVSLVTVFGALNWIAVLFSYLSMIRAMKVQNIPRSVMPYRNILLPWGAWIALFITILVILFSGYSAFIPHFQVDKFMTSYIGIPVYIINILWWKWAKKTKRVKPEEMDLVTGRRS
ncbi:amino acid permease-like protein [Thermochaetoides thermophila DSM 1495]|uniref:Amino acid permease-like protein n=1 Tax=Chaetomium thermophilum (strain DSM 1495 / CBS 144.50 / IMI 039719) TaxID=759272 RepID=G0S3L2_CHATD|nr:amino acid permease-like protein [Thermochaetoides thermophila DSM 1495]EGS20339.1 amino acid permease-like protein [Thermochaetoides thermophila DSM 1495]